MMKISSMCFWVTAAALLLAGCGASSVGSAGPGRPIAAWIQEDITSAEITHTCMGQTTTWAAEGEELDALREWTNDLCYEPAEFGEGGTPGDAEGGEGYEISLTEGDYPGFCYVTTGPGEAWLLIEGCWHSVEEPSAPPVNEPPPPAPESAEALPEK